MSSNKIKIIENHVTKVYQVCRWSYNMKSSLGWESLTNNPFQLRLSFPIKPRRKTNKYIKPYPGYARKRGHELIVEYWGGNKLIVELVLRRSWDHPGVLRRSRGARRRVLGWSRVHHGVLTRWPVTVTTTSLTSAKTHRWVLSWSRCHWQVVKRVQTGVSDEAVTNQRVLMWVWDHWYEECWGGHKFIHLQHGGYFIKSVTWWVSTS